MDEMVVFHSGDQSEDMEIAEWELAQAIRKLIPFDVRFVERVERILREVKYRDQIERQLH